MFPSLPRKCPIMPQKVFLQNATIMSPEIVEEVKKVINTYTASTLPNGVYRNVFKLYNEEDPLGFVFYYHLEIYFRLNDEIF